MPHSTIQIIILPSNIKSISNRTMQDGSNSIKFEGEEKIIVLNLSKEDAKLLKKVL